jgi:tetratricopeptide (TPR) repeat protein
VTVALAALVLALPAALFVAWPLVRRAAAALPAVADDTRTGLEVEKVLALRALRELDLDREAGLLSDADYAELRTRYEVRASAILKRLDALPPPAAPAAPGRRARGAAAAAAGAPARPWTQRPLVLGGGAVGILVFGVVLGVLVVRYTAPAPPEASGPMAGPSGSEAPPGVGMIPGPDASAPGAEAGGGKPIPPGMLEGMLKAAHQALDAGEYQQAIAAYKAILKRQPTNVEAITHLGIILAIAGHADGAIEAFDRALAIQPDYAHALWDKGRVLAEQRQDYAAAIATWERFIQVTAPGADHDQARTLIREARAKLQAGGGAPRPGAAPAAPTGSKP